MVAHVRPAARQQEAHADLLRRTADTVVVARLGVDVLVIDHRGGAAADVLHQPKFGRDVRLLLGQRLRHRPDRRGQPVEQRLVVGQPTQESLEKMRVRVDHARHHGHVCGVDAVMRGGAQRCRRLPRTHRGQRVIFDVDVA
jgi:hypothetical protein